MQNQRYIRHEQLKGFGKTAQEKLQHSTVLVVGAGGLGCPALQYLAAAGVGKIGIVDHDHVQLSNLHRQILFETKDIGLLKADIAAAKLKSLNPEIEVEAFPYYLNNQLAWNLIQDYDIILDCTDNFSTRYLISDACRLLKKPLVFGAIFEYEGQVAVFNIENSQGLTASYRDLFPDPPKNDEVLNCNENGVLGVLPGMIGVLQATEAIKISTGIGDVLANRLMTINLLDYQNMILEIPTGLVSSYPMPTSKEEFLEMDYPVYCSESVPDIQEINAIELENILKNKDVLLIDVREMHEQPRIQLPHQQISLNNIVEYLEDKESKPLILICQSGKRSLLAAQMLLDAYGNRFPISHVKGGVNSLLSL